MSENVGNAPLEAHVCTRFETLRQCADCGSFENADPTIIRTETVVRLYRESSAENGRLRSAVTEAIALLEDGTDYEKLHVVGTLRAALGDPT